MKNRRLTGDKSLDIVLDNNGKTTMAYFPAKKSQVFNTIWKQSQEVSFGLLSEYLLFAISGILKKVPRKCIVIIILFGE